MKASSFPVVIDAQKEPQSEDWVHYYQDKVMSELQQSGAVLLRNFPILSPETLQTVLKSWFKESDFLDYTGGTSPRQKQGEVIYSSTEMPFFLKIPLHSEMAYRHKFPQKIAFYCHQAPWIGGETPIVNLKQMVKDIPEILQMKLKRDDIIYYRHLKNYTAVTKFLSVFNPMLKMATWQYVFNSEDPIVVAQYCEEHAYQMQWRPDGSVILSTHLPAYLPNGDWFNSFHFFQVHPRIWGRVITPLAKFIRWLTRSPDMSATTGKGERLTDTEISSIVDAYEKNAVLFRWQKGDLLLLDNTQTAHGRNAYLGARKILVALMQEGSFTA